MSTMVPGLVKIAYKYASGTRKFLKKFCEFEIVLSLRTNNRGDKLNSIQHSDRKIRGAENTRINAIEIRWRLMKIQICVRVKY